MTGDILRDFLRELVEGFDARLLKRPGTKVPLRAVVIALRSVLDRYDQSPPALGSKWNALLIEALADEETVKLVLANNPELTERLRRALTPTPPAPVLAKRCTCHGGVTEDAFVDPLCPWHGDRWKLPAPVTSPIAPGLSITPPVEERWRCPDCGREFDGEMAYRPHEVTPNHPHWCNGIPVREPVVRVGKGEK